MELAGEKLIPASRGTVWEALNDPEVLRKCVPGCQSLTKLSDTEMEAVSALKVGPVSARFSGRITLSELNAPVSYRITGEGQGGVAGFARGSAFVELEEVADGTLLKYAVDAQVGGKLAQLGGRMIDATARKMSDAFFEKFAAEVQEGAVQSAAPAGPAGGEEIAGARSAAAPALAAVRQPNLDRPAFANAERQHGNAAGGSSSSRVPFLASLALAAVFAFLWLSGVRPDVANLGPSGGLSPEFTTAIQLILIAAVGYLFGRISDRRP